MSLPCGFDASVDVTSDTPKHSRASEPVCVNNSCRVTRAVKRPIERNGGDKRFARFSTILWLDGNEEVPRYSSVRVQSIHRTELRHPLAERYRKTSRGNNGRWPNTL